MMQGPINIRFTWKVFKECGFDGMGIRLASVI